MTVECEQSGWLCQIERNSAVTKTHLDFQNAVEAGKMRVRIIPAPNATLSARIHFTLFFCPEGSRACLWLSSKLMFVFWKSQGPAHTAMELRRQVGSLNSQQMAGLA